MSIVFENDAGYYISHENYINNIYKNVENRNFNIKEDLFKIFVPYKTGKNKLSNLDNKVHPDVAFVQTSYDKFLEDLVKQQLIKASNNTGNNNWKALTCAEDVYQGTANIVQNALGENPGPPIIKTINNSRYLFPENCKFYAKDVKDIEQHLHNEQFDLVVLDPPWWNKYIRRKRKKCDHSYNMMYNEDLMNIPIDKLLKDSGLVVVWCTNSEQHLSNLTEQIFKKWGIQFLTKWFWLKVTKSGEPVCKFAPPPGKQPFEQIIIGGRNIRWQEEDNKKLVVSIPSAIHSHKPPLVELLKKYVPIEGKCLEIFARYLLPGWTSYGNEVLKLQHEILFES